MSEDVKTLRDSIAMLAGEKTWCEDTLIAANIIIRRVVADMIEREEGANCRKELHERFKDRPDLNAQMDAPAPPSIDDFTTDLSAEDRGWNAALDTAIQEMRERGFMMDADPTVMMLRRLRRTERGER
jgi:hypothetical protein